MDLEKLQGTAVSAVQQNVEEFETKQRQAAERAEAVARLGEVMQAREEVFRGLASLAVRYSAGRVGESMAIPVGRVAVPTPSGESVERNLHAVVQNAYDDRLKVENIEDLDAVAPETVRVTFSVEAEEGDVDSGLFTTTGSIGAVEDGGEVKMLYGQRLAGETYEHFKAPVSESLKGSPTADSTTILYGAETYSTEGAGRELAVINAQLPTMQETLDLLQAGIQQAQSVVKQ